MDFSVCKNKSDYIRIFSYIRIQVITTSTKIRKEAPYLMRFSA